MAGLAPGGHGPVLTMSMMGISALIIGTLIDPIAGLVPLFGILCLMTSVFLLSLIHISEPRDRG